jgi:hypothetical protein
MTKRKQPDLRTVTITFTYEEAKALERVASHRGFPNLATKVAHVKYQPKDGRHNEVK